jgi:TetR/AcrR family transcriptional regulator, transcriptional repressor for nem operon
MARYSPEHKEATRRRLIEAAGRRFKSDGLDGSGIAALVGDVGLTNGAFYGHFESKDDLIASVVAQQLVDQVARVEALPVGLASLEAFIREYLSPAHRDDRSGGCPSAALLDEIARSDAEVREAYTEGARAMVRAVARHLDDGDPELATQRAIGLFTMLVASLQLARAVTDPALSDQVLAAAYANAVTIATAPLHSASPTGQESP